MVVNSNISTISSKNLWQFTQNKVNERIDYISDNYMRKKKLVFWFTVNCSGKESVMYPDVSIKRVKFIKSYAL
jgi:hypothetical protein